MDVVWSSNASRRDARHRGFLLSIALEGLCRRTPGYVCRRAAVERLSTEGIAAHLLRGTRHGPRRVGDAVDALQRFYRHAAAGQPATGGTMARASAAAGLAPATFLCVHGGNLRLLLALLALALPLASSPLPAAVLRALAAWVVLQRRLLSDGDAEAELRARAAENWDDGRPALLEGLLSCLQHPGPSPGVRVATAALCRYAVSEPALAPPDGCAEAEGDTRAALMLLLGDPASCTAL